MNKSSCVVVLSAVVSGSERREVSEAEPQNLRILNQSVLNDRGDDLCLCDHSFIRVLDVVFWGNRVAVNV